MNLFLQIVLLTLLVYVGWEFKKLVAHAHGVLIAAGNALNTTAATMLIEQRAAFELLARQHTDVLSMITTAHGASATQLSNSSDKLMLSTDSFHNAATRLVNAAKTLMESADCFDDMRKDLSDMRRFQVGDKFR